MSGGGLAGDHPDPLLIYSDRFVKQRPDETSTVNPLAYRCHATCSKLTTSTDDAVLHQPNYGSFTGLDQLYYDPTDEVGDLCELEPDR